MTPKQDVSLYGMEEERRIQCTDQTCHAMMLVDKILVHKESAHAIGSDQVQVLDPGGIEVVWLTSSSTSVRQMTSIIANAVDYCQVNKMLCKSSDVRTGSGK